MEKSHIIYQRTKAWTRIKYNEKVLKIQNYREKTLQTIYISFIRPV